MRTVARAHRSNGCFGCLRGGPAGGSAQILGNPCRPARCATYAVIDIKLKSAKVQVTARLPDPLSEELDAAAHRLQRSRADLIRQAIEYYLDDIVDLQAGVAALKDPADPVLDWLEVRDALLAAD